MDNQFEILMEKLHGPRECFCVGPQNGDPVCPCQMPDYRRQKLMEAMTKAYLKEKTKRVRVKAVSRPHEAVNG